MAKTYISYSHKDRDFAHLLIARLKGYDHEITVDDAVLAPGLDWRATLDQGLRSADIFVVLLSKHSVSSQNTLMEVGAARAFAGANGRPLIIPIAIDAVGIPMPLQDIQTIVAPDRDLDLIVSEVNRGISSFHGISLARELRAEEIAQRIQSSAPSYIEEAIKAQEAIKARNALAARLWYAAGFLTLLGGMAIVLLTYSTHLADGQDWILLIRSLVVNILMVGFLGASSRYSFSLGKSYTTEALKASDRIHAINFGRFYLKAFPDRVSWEELKEVFANWNIDRTSSFSALDVSQIDPQVLSTVAQIAGAFGNKK